MISKEDTDTIQWLSMKANMNLLYQQSLLISKMLPPYTDFPARGVSGLSCEKMGLW